MNSKSIIIRWMAPALLPLALTVFWLLPVSAEAPVAADGDRSSVEELEAYAANNDAIVVDSEVYVTDDDVTVVALETPADYAAGAAKPVADDAEYEGEYDAAYNPEIDDGAVEVVILPQNELDALVGPVALYPDDLLAIVLPASTYPLEIVQAARFLDEHEKDSSLKPSEDWDESVTALLNYPEVVRMMNDDIEWTWKLGGAVLNQQADVIAAVETFRDRAYAAGNLKSDDYQTVNNDGENIEITRTREEVIYVPYYEPERVVIRQVEPVYYYYPRPYPVYYYPYPEDYYFSSGFFWGVTTAFRIGWSNHHLRVHHHSFWGHPYYGRSYYGHHYYRRPSVTIYNNWYVNNSRHHPTHRYRDGDYWRPRPASGIRPNGHSARRPALRDGYARDGVARNPAATLASQPTQTRPVNRIRDRNVDRTQRAVGDRARDRDLRVATGNSGQNRNRALRQGAENEANPSRVYGDTIRFRERPPVTTSTRPVTRPNRPATAKPGATSTARPRPVQDAGQSRTRALRQRNEADTSRVFGDTIRFRERPAPVTTATRPAARPAKPATVRPGTPGAAQPRPLQDTSQDRGRAIGAQRGDTVNANRSRDTIRFRERPEAAGPATRRPAQPTNAAGTPARSRVANTSVARERQPSNRSTSRPVVDRSPARQTVRRTNDRPRVASERSTTRKPVPARSTTQRQTTRQAAPAQNQSRRAQANRKAESRPEKQAAPKQKKASSKNHEPQRAERAKKRRR